LSIVGGNTYSLHKRRMRKLYKIDRIGDVYVILERKPGGAVHRFGITKGGLLDIDNDKDEFSGNRIVLIDEDPSDGKFFLFVASGAKIVENKESLSEKTIEMTIYMVDHNRPIKHKIEFTGFAENANPVIEHKRLMGNQDCLLITVNVGGGKKKSRIINCGPNPGDRNINELRVFRNKTDSKPKKREIVINNPDKVEKTKLDFNWLFN